MTKEELEKEAEECMHNILFWLKLPINKKNVEEGSSYILKLLEPREKRIEELEAQIEQLVYFHNEDLETIRILNKLIEEMKCCINDLVHLGEFNENTDEEYLNYQVHEALKNAEAFLNGEVFATENGVEWHDLEKSPNDLPENKRNVWCDYAGGWCVEGHLYCPITDAWCELPKRNKGERIK